MSDKFPTNQVHFPPNSLLNQSKIQTFRSAMKHTETMMKTVSQFAKKSKETSSNLSLQSHVFKHKSFTKTDAELLKSVRSLANAGNFIENINQQEITAKFGDKILLFSNNLDQKNDKQTLFVMGGDGRITSSVFFSPLSDSICSDSINDALFEIMDFSIDKETETDFQIHKFWEEFNTFSSKNIQNEIDQLDQHSSQVLSYGQGFVLQHCSSKRFLSVVSCLDHQGLKYFKFILSEKNNEQSIFKLFSIDHQLDQGFAVIYSNPINIRDQKFNLAFSLNKTSNSIYDDHSLTITDDEETAWNIYLYSRKNDNQYSINNQKMYSGEIVQLFDRENKGLFTCSYTKKESDVEKIKLCYSSISHELTSNLILEVNDLKNPFCKGYNFFLSKNNHRSAFSLWEIENKEFGKNNPILSQEEILLRNIGAGLYLKYNMNDNQFSFDNPMDGQKHFFSLATERESIKDIEIELTDNVCLKSNEEYLVQLVSKLIPCDSGYSKNMSENDQINLQNNILASNLTKIEFSKTSFNNSLKFRIEKNQSFIEMGVFLSKLNLFIIDCSNYFLSWDTVSCMGMFQFDSNITIQNHSKFIDKIKLFEEVLMSFAKMISNYDCQTFNNKLDFSSLDKNFEGFYDVIIELRIIQNIIEIASLIITKTYSLGLKIFNIQVDKDNDQNDLIVYKNLFDLLEKTDKKSKIFFFRELHNYEFVLKKILQFLTIAVSKNTKIAEIIFENTNFIFQLFSFFEEDVFELIIQLLSSIGQKEQSKKFLLDLLKHVFLFEEPSDFLIKLISNSKVIQKLIAKMDIELNSEMIPILNSYMFFSKPFFYFANSSLFVDVEFTRKLKHEYGFGKKDCKNESDLEIRMVLPECLLISRIFKTG